MTYTNAHLLLRIHGGFGASVGALVDRWSTGLRIAIPGQDIRYDAAALQTFVNACHAAVQPVHISSTMVAGTSCFFTHCTVARVGEDGFYDPQGQLTLTSTGSTGTGAGTPSLPWNTALQIGLRTGNPRGLASNGRMYYPALAATLTAATGRVSGTVISNRLTLLRSMLIGIRNAAATYDLGAAPCVMSNKGTGQTAVITAIRSDDRLDSIERRENAAPSTYTVLAL